MFILLFWLLLLLLRRGDAVMLRQPFHSLLVEYVPAGPRSDMRLRLFKKGSHLLKSVLTRDFFPYSNSRTWRNL